MSEIHIAKKKKRSQNTSPAQFERYLQEMENDYVFRSNTINPTLDQHYLVKKWAMLRHDLNSMGTGPELSVEEWKTRFQEWKYSIKKKSRLITEDLHKTGGGPKLNIQMTLHEERGLNVFGKITVVGTKDVTPYVGLVLPHTVVATCSSEAEGVIVLEDNINITEPEIILTNNSSENVFKENVEQKLNTNKYINLLIIHF